MSFSSVLVFLGVVATACSCPQDCVVTRGYHRQFFSHVSDLQNSSVAPWSLIDDSKEGREPKFIQKAVCKECAVEHMVARPILLKIQVYQRSHEKNSPHWCRCPYDLAVGCTCVNKQAM